MSGWEDAFRPAEYGPIADASAGPWRTLVHPRETAPEDLAASEVLHFLRHDAVLQRVFRDKFDRTHGPINNFQDFPRCVVYVAASVPAGVPTATVLRRVSIVVSTFWDMTSFAPIADGAASISTVLMQIERVLQATKNRVLTVVWNGVQTALAETNMAVQAMNPGTIDDVQGRPLGTVHPLEVQYTLKCDQHTGQITRLV